MLIAFHWPIARTTGGMGSVTDLATPLSGPRHSGLGERLRAIPGDPRTRTVYTVLQYSNDFKNEVGRGESKNSHAAAFSFSQSRPMTALAWRVAETRAWMGSLNGSWIVNIQLSLL